MIYTVLAKFGYFEDADCLVVYCGTDKEAAFNLDFQTADKIAGNAPNSSSKCNILCLQEWKDGKLENVYTNNIEFEGDKDYEGWRLRNMQTFGGI